MLASLDVDPKARGNDLTKQLATLVRQGRTVPYRETYVVAGPKPKADKPVKAAKAPAAEEPKAEEVKVEAAKAPTYDFNTDISPLVLRVAAEKGRPAIAELLSQFGVERASNVPAEQFGELLNALKDALGE